MSGSHSPLAAARSKFIRRIGFDTPFYRLFDHMPDVAFFAKDRSFRLMCASQRFIERFGFRDEAEVVGYDLPGREADLKRIKPPQERWPR